MKKFCIAGPIIPDIHYFLPQRLNWKQLTDLISGMEYFVLHAPRQSGKTTAIEEFIRHLNNDAPYKALYINIEDAQAARDDVTLALITIVSILKEAIAISFKEDEITIHELEKLIKDRPVTLDLWRRALAVWCQASSKPIVLFIDEIDSLVGDSLLSVLRQIRAGFNQRPKYAPQSVCLIGLRDVRDYKIYSQEAGGYVSASSPFNIKAISLTLKNFSLEEVRTLYGQHTQETGQGFTEEAIQHAYYLTRGQPWLVNALGHEACFVMVTDRNQPITKEVIEDAKDEIIRRRDTHIDSLLDKLDEPRVAEVIDSIISGAVTHQQFTKDDEQYCIDLGILSSTADTLEIANPIYQQIIPAVLASKFQKRISQDMRSYLRADCSLDMPKLLEEFTQFYRENSETWLKGYNYKEAGPHILMLAYMQKLINGGGTIDREYALGNKRVDLFITWKNQKFVLELKMRNGEASFVKGLEQIAHYMDVSGAQGYLVIFDRDQEKSWEEKISHEILPVGSKQVHVWTL